MNLHRILSFTFACCTFLLLLQEGRGVFAQEPVAELVEKADKLMASGDYAKAVQSYDEAISKSPESWELFYLRGRAKFCAHQLKESVADFDRYYEKVPDAQSRQWERGIALYYVERFQDGADQFELYQTYHDNDVENATWRYLCVARAKSVEDAKKTLLPIRNDRRPPMMDIYELYRGNRKPEEVLDIARKLEPNSRDYLWGNYYAELYVGLWYEVQGNKDLAKKHIAAAKKFKIPHYMWNVSDVHLKLLESEK